MSIATDMLAAYQNAELAVLQGLSVRMGDRQLTRANLPEIIAGRREWEQRVAAELLTAASGCSRGPLSTWGASFSDGYSNYQRRGWDENP